MLGWKFSGAITKHSETKHQWNLWLLSNRKCDFELLLVNSYMKTVRSFYSNFKRANELLLKYLLMAPFLPWLLCHPNNNKKWVISNWFLKWKEEVGWSRYRGYSFFYILSNNIHHISMNVLNKHPGCLFKILSKKRRVLIRKKAIIWGGHLSISCTDSLEGEAWKVITKEAIETGLPCISAT